MVEVEDRQTNAREINESVCSSFMYQLLLISIRLSVKVLPPTADVLAVTRGISTCHRSSLTLATVCKYLDTDIVQPLYYKYNNQ